MRGRLGVSAAVVWASFAALHCGAEPPLSTAEGLQVQLQSAQQLDGHFEREGHRFQLSSVRSSPLAGDVRVDSGSLRYEVHYDYEARQVITDGHGGTLEYEAQRPLLDAIELLTEHLERGGAEPALHERMLFASLGMLRDSGGMRLERQVFDLGPAVLVPGQAVLVPGQAVLVPGQAVGGDIDKGIGDDGIRCIKSGETHLVSFDFADTTVLDVELQAGSFECNGQCGPYCTQLQPWRMWTLDCLEHDACCNVTSDDACWTPLGECGDEYEEAMGDFSRGFAPFSRHCGG